MAEAYAGLAWANELARRGFAVLVPDAFAFGSRRVRLADVPDILRPPAASDDDSVEAVERYNAWAGEHETVMAKSLFAAGVTWPGVWLAEDLVALDILCSRYDVDAARVGCGGLSAGGLRTVYLAGLDDRIACAVCVGMMTTWRDFVLDISARHTWMAYVPHLPRALDYPEILGLRAPLPTLVMNNSDDHLFTLSEMQRADEMLANVYQRFGAGDRYRCSYYPGPHKFDRAMQDEAFAWWEKWL
jgi:dienelactone hydrolase